MIRIERFAANLLERREWQLVERLALVLDDDVYDAGSLVEEMIPVYWEQVGDRRRQLFPDNIYRPLYYVQMYSDGGNCKDNARPFMMAISAHLEGCL